MNEVNQLRALQEKIDSLPGETKDGKKILGPEAWKSYQSLLAKQKEIGRGVLERVLKDNPQWRDKIKIDNPPENAPDSGAKSKDDQER